MFNQFQTFWILLFFSILPLFLFGQNIEEIQSLQSSIELVDSDTAKINLLLKLANEYKSNDYIKAIEYFNEAYQLSLDKKNNLYLCKSVVEYLDCLYGAGLYDSLFVIVENEEYNIVKCNDSLLIARMYFFQGSAYRQQYDYHDAKIILTKGESFVGSKYNKLKADFYNRIGLCHLYLAEYDSTVFYYFLAREVFEEIYDTTGITKMLINIGKVYFLQEDYITAQNYWLEAMDFLEKSENPVFESLALSNLGTVDAKLKNYNHALDYFQQAYDISDQLNRNVDKGDIINNMGHIYFQMGKYDKAMAQFKKSTNFFKNLNYLPGELTSRNNLAWIYSERKNYSLALAMLDTVLHIAKENDLTDKTLMAYKSIANNLYKYGKYQPAYDTLREWIELNDSIFNIKKTKIINTLELKYQKEKNESKILALQNEALQKDSEIKQKINQRNIISGSAIAIVIILSLLFFLHRQRTRKDRIIKEKEILRLKEEKKALAAHSIVEGQEEERKRIARELHDGLGVLLTNVKMQFSSFMDKSTGDKKLLSKAASVLNQASVDVRRISHNMMPGNLSKFGLVAAIEDLFEEVNESGKIVAEMKDDLADERFSENMEIMLYRIVQELVNNTIKHSGASSISLNLNKSDNKILVRYSDNGSGFDPEKAKSGKSMGLKSIEDRINFLGGNLSIESEVGKGASFVFDFPV